MLARSLRIAFALLLYFSLATLIAEAIVVGYLASQWQIDEERFSRLVAVAQGLELPGPPAAAPREPEVPPTEQLSYDQVLEARAMKDKNLQLRELALANALAQLKTDRQKAADDEKRYQQQLGESTAKLESISKGAKATGRELAGRILEKAKPKQARELLLQMLENKEIDDVVLLLSGMTDSSRGKILGEFKTTDDVKKIDEVLRLIRQGVPEAPIAEKAKGQLQPAAGAP